MEGVQYGTKRKHKIFYIFVCSHASKNMYETLLNQIFYDMIQSFYLEGIDCYRIASI